jgi:hypothetical protein
MMGTCLQLTDRRMSPDLPRGTVNLIGGELDVNEPRLRTNGTALLVITHVTRMTSP